MIPSFPVRRTENRRGACCARATVVPRGLQDGDSARIEPAVFDQAGVAQW